MDKQIIQVNAKDSISEIADSIILEMMIKLSSANTSDSINNIIKSIRDISGDEAANNIKNGFLNVINENITGIKKLKVDLVEFLLKNNGKKFEISINERKE